MSTPVPVALRLRRIMAFLNDPRVPKLPRLAVIFAVAYLISPVDLIPGAIAPVIGWLDDLTVMWLALRWLIKEGDGATAAAVAEAEPFPPSVQRVEPPRDRS